MKKRLMATVLAAFAGLGLCASASATTVTLESGLYAKVDTTMGNFIIELYAKDAPLTVSNFASLAEGVKQWTDPKTGEIQRDTPLYDGTVFHRVARGVLIQGGDPSGTGAGDIGFTIPMEQSPELKHDRPGRVAMARRKSLNSASCQFYIILRPLPQLDDLTYAVFGQVIHGLDAVRNIADVPTDPASPGKSRPIDDVVMKKVTILTVPEGETLDVELNALTPVAEVRPKQIIKTGGSAATGGGYATNPENHEDLKKKVNTMFFREYDPDRPRETWYHYKPPRAKTDKTADDK